MTLRYGGNRDFADFQVTPPFGSSMLDMTVRRRRRSSDDVVPSVVLCQTQLKVVRVVRWEVVAIVGSNGLRVSRGNFLRLSDEAGREGVLKRRGIVVAVGRLV